MTAKKTLQISKNVSIPVHEIELSTIRSQGAGGQNVNKVATGIHLRFDIRSSSLPESYQRCLLLLHDQRITSDGMIVIKAQRYRSQEKNRLDALERLRELIRDAVAVRKRRLATSPSRTSQQKRLEQKKQRGVTKSLRRKITD